MGRTKNRKKQYRKLAPDPCLPVHASPSFSRGWIRIRRPMYHPWEVIRLLRMWLRLKRELDRSPGLLAFEYRLRLRPFMIGMHVVWRSQAEEIDFYKNSSHKQISNWSLKSPLTPALRLEHFHRDEQKHLVELGGFYVFESESDLPEEIH